MSEVAEGTWGLYPWFEEHGVHCVHSNDIDDFRTLSPYGKVFLCTGQENEFIKLTYGERTFRVKPDLFSSVPSIQFPIGTKVVIRSKNSDAIVDEIHWHHRDAKPIYFVRRDGKRDSRRYSSDDLDIHHVE